MGLTVCLVAGASFAQPAGEPSSKSGLPAEEVKTEIVGKSVVKIFSTLRYPDRFQPWSKKAPVSATVSGVVIDGKRILTTAHAVAYSSDIQVVAKEGSDKMAATVEAFSPEVDLAVLKLEDEGFFTNHPPLKRTLKLPQIKGAVATYGFPAEGASLSRTKGVVSHIDFTGASLRIRLDSVLGPGNDGGPAVVGDEMVGLSSSPPSKMEKATYITPSEDIDLFLEGIRKGEYHGRPMLDIVVQELQHPALRSFLGVDKSVHGVVVQQVGPLPADNPLKKWDIITQVGQTNLDDQGMVSLENGLRLPFPYLFSQTSVHGRAPMTVVRAGQPLQLEVPIRPNLSRLMSSLNGAYPDYFVYGPLVFSDASQDFFYDLVSATIAGSAGLSGSMRLLAQETPLVTRCNDFSKFDGERLVVVTAFFRHKLSENYTSPVTHVVKTINGTPIKNLSHLVGVLRDCKDKFVSIEFFGRYSDTLVFPREEMLANTDQILTDNNVHNQGSPAIMALWNVKKKD